MQRRRRSLGTYANIKELGIINALPKTTEEKIEEQQIYAKGFLNSAERYKRKALIYERYTSESRGLHKEAITNMNFSIGYLKTAKRLVQIK